MVKLKWNDYYVRRDGLIMYISDFANDTNKGRLITFTSHDDAVTAWHSNGKCFGGTQNHYHDIVRKATEAEIDQYKMSQDIKTQAEKLLYTAKRLKFASNKKFLDW